MWIPIERFEKVTNTREGVFPKPWDTLTDTHSFFFNVDEESPDTVPDLPLPELVVVPVYVPVTPNILTPDLMLLAFKSLSPAIVILPL